MDVLWRKPETPILVYGEQAPSADRALAVNVFLRHLECAVRSRRIQNMPGTGMSAEIGGLNADDVVLLF